MTKVISFEKFSALKAAGIADEEVRSMHHAPQIHSASESFVQTVAHRASAKPQLRGY